MVDKRVVCDRLQNNRQEVFKLAKEQVLRLKIGGKETRLLLLGISADSEKAAKAKSFVQEYPLVSFGTYKIGNGTRSKEMCCFILKDFSESTPRRKCLRPVIREDVNPWMKDSVLAWANYASQPINDDTWADMIMKGWKKFVAVNIKG